MTTFTRAAGKTFYKSLSHYENQKNLVSRAVHPTTPSLVKSHPKNRDKLEDAFGDLSHDWKIYKADLAIPDTEFNEVEETVPKYEYNDAWFEATELDYFELLEKSDEKPEVSSPPTKGIEKEGKANKEKIIEEKHALQEQKLADSLGSQISSLTDSISGSIASISKEVMNMDDGGESVGRVQGLRLDLNNLDNKIDDIFNRLYSQYICLLSDSEAKEKESLRSLFIKQEKLKISNTLLILSKKAKEPDRTSSSSPSNSNDSKQQTYLKKADPPKWLGDPLEFADFKRKWVNQVSSANMLPEAELDRLRENIPSQAAKALFGETIVAKAWKILENLYGDKDLIAGKLKSQLKNIRVKGKHDYDIIIDLVTDVKNIVLRLQSVGAEEMLHVDSEFLGAIFRVLPSNSQVKWLDFDKSLYKSKWSAFMQYMEVAREQALQTKVLMAGYEQQSDSGGTCHKCGKTGHRAKYCTEMRVNAVNANADARDKIKEEKKKAKEECGKCPLCHERHTFIRLSDRDEWPSDRLFKCDLFKDMSIRDRAATLERLSACPKCTSWNHQRGGCISPAKCAMIISGNKCDGDHSSMVCGSGSAYCGSIRSVALCSSLRSGSDSPASVSSSPSSTILSSVSTELSSTSSSSASGFAAPGGDLDKIFPDIHAETLLLFQDVPVTGGSRPANVCWDDGSNRCIVTHAFAEMCAMRKPNIVLGWMLLVRRENLTKVATTSSS